METIEQILENLADGKYDGFYIEFPSSKAYRNGPTTSRWSYIKDGKIVQCVETASKFFDGKENVRSSNIEKTILEAPEEIVEWLQKYGYKAYEHEDLRQFSKNFYNERDRLRELQRVAESVKENIVDEGRPVVAKTAEEAKEAVGNIVREAGKEAAQKGAKERPKAARAAEGPREEVHDFIKEVKRGFGAKVVEGSKDVAANVVEKTKETVAKTVEESKDFGAKVVKGSKDVAANVAGQTKDVVVKTVEGTKDLGTKVVKGSKDVAVNVAGQAKDTAAKAAKGAQKAVKDSADSIIKVMEENPKQVAAGAGIAVGVAAIVWGAVKMSPHVKKWWRDSISPRFKRGSDENGILCPACGNKMDDEDDQWKCPTCKYSISKERAATEIFWFCDNCGSFLNVQEDFDSSKDAFVCKECGFLNELSESNITDGSEMNKE